MSIWDSPLWLVMAGLLFGFFLGTVVMGVLVRRRAGHLSEAEALSVTAGRASGGNDSAAVGGFVLLAVPGFLIVPVLGFSGYFAADLPWWSWVAAVVVCAGTTVLVARAGVRQVARVTGGR